MGLNEGGSPELQLRLRATLDDRQLEIAKGLPDMFQSIEWVVALYNVEELEDKINANPLYAAIAVQLAQRQDEIIGSNQVDTVESTEYDVLEQLIKYCKSKCEYFGGKK